jgi:uncharacterized protein (TIGR02757 family)
MPEASSPSPKRARVEEAATPEASSPPPRRARSNAARVGRSRSRRASIAERPAALRSLRRHLDVMAAEYDYAAHLQRDPLRHVVVYDDPRDVEVAGLFAACLAYGRVDRVLVSVADVLGRMGAHPADFVRDFDPRGRTDRKAFRGFLHRMTGDAEIRHVCAALGRVLRELSSLENLFARGMPAATIRPGLQAFVETVRAYAFESAESDARTLRRLRFLLPGPAEGSACKRLNMWLRWMIRRQDGLDPGPWTAARPSQLMIPLDVHVVRLSQFFGMTSRTTPDWKMAEEVMTVLRLLDPEDPVKYDFALSHIGMSRAHLPGV